MVVAGVAGHGRNGFFVFRPGQGWEYTAMLGVLGIAIGAWGARMPMDANHCGTAARRAASATLFHPCAAIIAPVATRTHASTTSRAAASDPVTPTIGRFYE
jgi:putative oxidoreductase